MSKSKEIKIPLSQLATPESIDRLLRLLREQQRAGAVLKFDASRVREFDIERLQLLLAAVRGNPGVKICRMTEGLRKKIESLGLMPHLESALEVDDGRSETPALETIQTEAVTTERAEPTDMTKRILTIDDSKTMRDMLMITLADAGFDVLQAVDGEDGIAVLEREHVDLVITDINMPKMDGYEVIRRVRANPAYKKLPVLVLTTEGENDKRAIAKEAGATGWMVKPFDPQRLIETVAKVAA